jgi:hypothetical protein
MSNPQDCILIWIYRTQINYITSVPHSHVVYWTLQASVPHSHVVYWTLQASEPYSHVVYWTLQESVPYLHVVYWTSHPVCILYYSHCVFSYIQYIKQQNAHNKCNETQIIKYTSCLVPTPICISTKVPSSGSLITTKVNKSNTFLDASRAHFHH